MAGVWLGLGFLSRAPTLLAFPLAIAMGLRRTAGPKGTARFVALLALGVAPALLGQAAYNWVRFGDASEFGYRWMNSPASLLERQMTWGQFSFHFLPENLYTLLVRPPLVSVSPLRIEPDPWGMGLLLTCPALLLALPVRSLVEGVRSLSGREGSDPPKAIRSSFRSIRLLSAPFAKTNGRCLCLGLWLSVALVQLPSLLYFNTGSYQFGYRFALDWLPLGVLLVALATGGKLRWWGKALIVAGAMIYLWGVLWMYPNFNGQPWHLQYGELLRWLG
jgi:hypothetical protein